MAVEYEISSDVATIKDVAPNTQVARVVSLYSGQITYDDEAGSKFATATIDGKSQRVMLCIAVNGTVNYDDVPSLYSTVDGHRCLNIVAPTETGTPDDVPSVYETVVIDGMNVRAVRCILINETPIYDGVSNTCTFVANGKTHTAQLVNKITGGSVDVIVKGVSPLVLPDAIANSLSYVKAFGGTEQRNIPQPYTQVNYVTNTAQTAVDTGIMIDFAKNYEFEVECRAVSGSWYILQSRASASGNVTGIHGATSGSTIILVVGNVTVCTSAITRTVGNKLYVKATLNAGTATLYVKDETANTEDTQTGSYGTSQPNPTASVYLLGNAGGQYVDVNSDIYMARIKENDTVVMDYVPARQAATAGFYDKASGTFKTALTPANLSADGNTVPTPDAPMNIVSNNGVVKFGVLGKNLFGNVNAQQGYLDSNGDIVENSSWLYTANYIPVKPSTTYTFTPNSETGGFPKHIYYDKNKSLIGEINSGPKTFTTPSNCAFMRFSYRDSSFDIQLEQGNTVTPYEPYRAGIYTDGTVETINIHTKNLSPNELDHVGYNSTGATSSSLTFCGNLHKIKCAPGDEFTVSCGNFPDGISGVFVNTWKTDGTWNQRQAIAMVSSYTYTIPAGIGEVNFTLYKTGGITIGSTSWLQVERGNTPTEYQPYYDGGTATAEMLLKVGDYQDVQSIIDGVVTRNVGVKVLDGTENWNTYSVAQGTLFRIMIADSVSDGKDASGVLCNAYRVVSVVNRTSGTLSGATTNYDFINDNYTTDTSWKQYLADQYAAGTPVIIVYPLATPTTESVAGQTLQVTDGDNTLEITQASLNGLELEAKYQVAVSLTIQEVQDANLDPNVEVTIN